jgi:hypothetical protein
VSALIRILKAVAVLSRLIFRLGTYFARLRALREGEDRATAKALQEQDERVRKARSARDAVDPRRLPDDDPYLRD